MISKTEILNEFNELCKLAGKKLSRGEYRTMNPTNSTSLIEKIWGTWKNFMEEADFTLQLTRVTSTKVFNKKANKVVITYAMDGSEINVDCFTTLLNYCKENKAELGILWGKSYKKNSLFSKFDYALINKYLATSFEFEKDSNCLAKDFLIPQTQKNPLMNLDKLSTDLTTIIVGSTKQYLRMLPYKQFNAFRVGCSTGTISNVEYKETVAGQIDNKYHKLGAILLEWNEEHNRYFVRNLVYKNGFIYDLDKRYSSDGVKKVKNIPALVLGDLHLPEDDEEALKKTMKFMSTYNPKTVLLHDVASWNSISHHEMHQYLSKVKNTTAESKTLEDELNAVVINLKYLANSFKNTEFKIVNSNHDDFIRKWLETGEFTKDKANARIGAKLFEMYLDDKNILSEYLPNNVQYLKLNTSFSIAGIELSEHGDAGISGARGSVNSFNKTYEDCICGHTHSPEIFEKTVYVGTLSKLKLSYNQKGMTKWAHCNAVVYENGTSQLIFI